MAVIQKEAALAKTIPILFPLYFYDCHVDRGGGGVGGRHKQEKKRSRTSSSAFEEGADKNVMVNSLQHILADAENLNEHRQP